MNNKYLVTVIAPQLELEFDIYIPNNKKVGTIKNNIIKSIRESSNGSFTKDNNSVRMIDREYGIEYDNNIFIKDSKIRNGTKLVIM